MRLHEIMSTCVRVLAAGPRRGPSENTEGGPRHARFRPRDRFGSPRRLPTRSACAIDSPPEPAGSRPGAARARRRGRDAGRRLLQHRGGRHAPALPRPARRQRRGRSRRRHGARRGAGVPRAPANGLNGRRPCRRWSTAPSNRDRRHRRPRRSPRAGLANPRETVTGATGARAARPRAGPANPREIVLLRQLSKNTHRR